MIDVISYIYQNLVIIMLLHIKFKFNMNTKNIIII